VWNAANSYDTQATLKYAIASDFSQYRDLQGQTLPIGNGVVMIGSKPILLEKPGASTEHKAQHNKRSGGLLSASRRLHHSSAFSRQH